MARRAKSPIKIFAPGQRSRSRPNRWCVAEIWQCGKRRYVTLDGVTDPEEARSIAAEYLAAASAVAVEDECRRSTTGPDRRLGAPATFGALARRYIADRRVGARERRHVERLVMCELPSLADMRLGDVELADVEPTLGREAASELYGHLSAPSMNRAGVSPFAAIVHFGAENNWMPYLKVKAFKSIDRVTPRLPGGEDDVEALLSAAAAASPRKMDRYKADHPYRFILLLFLFRQGWRISETLRLTWRQVDVAGGQFLDVLVDKGMVVKPSLPMHPQVREVLAGLPAGEPTRADKERRGRVFPWVDRHNVYRWLNPWCAEIGVHFRPHMARVEYASQLNDADQTAAAIAASCTWKGAQAVGRYIRTDARKAASANALAGSRAGGKSGDQAPEMRETPQKRAGAAKR